MPLRIITCLLLISSSTIRADESATPEQLEFFEKRIRPLLVTHCYSCHSSEAKKVKGDLYLDTRAGVLKGGALGPAVTPGEPDKSLVIGAVRYEGDLRMPPKGKLSDNEIADLVTWVKLGVPDPRTGKPLARTGGIDIEAGKKHWAFQSLLDATPPRVKEPAWQGNPIDRFMAAEYRKRKLTPAGLADRRTLIRRATFDLIGLPPTPQEIDAFLQDESPDAFAPVVDRLLASPHYGERWGRHWLDVVRYADTAGDNSDYPIPQMYRYRNWVIDAVNKDMPYDQFVRLQMAGDLISSDQDAVIATGYLANSRRFGSYEDARYPWHLTVEDTIDNVGKAFLGLTINCCRCHDHKFDPLTSEDYYGLYGFFSSTRYPWPGIELDKVPKDLVPLSPPTEVARATGERKQQLAQREAAVKRLENDKAAAEKRLKNTEDSAERSRLQKQVEQLNAALQTAKKDRDAVAKSPLPIEVAYAVIDGRNEPKKRIGQVGNVRVHMKGDPERLGKEVPRHFPGVLGGEVLSPDAKGSGRAELAEWLVRHPLTARVIVNRIWQYHFGKGIVATPNNFGKQGRLPTHPELLDFLARRFIDSGWSMKAMHRLIMLSRVYQLDSDPGADAKIDPGNDYLSHFSRRRLDAESIRDAMLAVCGNLDRTTAGPHPFPLQSTWAFTQHKPFKAVYDTNRRSVYLMTQRIARHPFLALFDGPDTNASTATRTTTTTPLQALFLMNDPFAHEQAEQFGVRLQKERSSDVERIDHAFMLVFGRAPTEEERARSLTFVRETQSRWDAFARALFMSNEFVYVN